MVATKIFSLVFSDDSRKVVEREGSKMSTISGNGNDILRGIVKVSDAERSQERKARY